MPDMKRRSIAFGCALLDAHRRWGGLIEREFGALLAEIGAPR